MLTIQSSSLINNGNISFSNTLEKNTTNILGYIPVIGSVVGVARLIFAGIKYHRGEIPLKSFVYNISRGTIESLGTGWSLLPLDITRTFLDVLAPLHKEQQAKKFYDLGIKKFIGDGVHSDKEGAAGLFTQAADLGLAIAQNDLGVMYESGNGAPKDLKKALELYKLAANQGNHFAQENLKEFKDLHPEFAPKDEESDLLAPHRNYEAQDRLGFSLHGEERENKRFSMARLFVVKAS